MDFLIVRLGTKNLTTQEFLDKLLKVFDDYKVELISVGSELPVETVNWWTGLPERSKLKTLTETWIWKDYSGTLPLRQLSAGDTSLEYWGRIILSNGKIMAKVFNNPELWVAADDVKPSG